MFLERWTIDQVMDNCVAVARAAYRHDMPEQDSGSIAKVAVLTETGGFSPQDWEPEFVSVLDRDQLLAELGSRTSARGVVAQAMAEEEDPRSLFEGQVLWMLTPERMPDERAGRPIGPGDTEWLFGRLPRNAPSAVDAARAVTVEVGARPGGDEAGHVIDVTQAARVAVKKQYEEAVASPPTQGAPGG